MASLAQQDGLIRMISGSLALGLIGVVSVYQEFLSPLLPPACRYTPSCSEYARQALRRHGLGRGLRMTVGRLCRCHPFHPGGLDPPR